MKDLTKRCMSFQRGGENGGIAYNVTVKLKIAVQNWKAPGKFLGHGHCWDLTRSQKVTTPVHTKEELLICLQYMSWYYEKPLPRSETGEIR